MRVLLTIQPATGHLHPIVPLARALARRGHDVAVACAPAFAAAVEAVGLRPLPAGLDWLEAEAERAFPQLRTMSLEAQGAWFVTDIFAGVTAERMATDVVALAGTWPPDVVVHESWEFGGALAAERLGVPHATLGIALHAPREATRQFMGPQLAALRRGQGLPPDPTLDWRFGGVYLHCLPLRYQPLPEEIPAAHAIRPPAFDRSADEPGPPVPWPGAVPGRPRVYATLGTVFNRHRGVLEAVLEGLRREPVNLLVTVGRNQDPAAFGPQPEHVRVERYVPQSLVFPSCDLAVTHGGYNTVMAALTHGVPMVLVPLSADQPFHAQRCAELGVGRVVVPEELAADTLRQAVRAVLATPAFRTTARRLQEEIAALPDEEHAVALLEGLARQGAPGTGARR
jgi:MGT family glycosyltransferase